MKTQTLDRFFSSLKDPNTQEIMKNLQKIKINQKLESQNMDLFMIEKVLPVLFAGLEELSREVERYQTQDDINPEIRERFNPCIFLGQYLMRNNPKYHDGNEKKIIEDFVRKEKCMRFFNERSEKFKNIFKNAVKTDKLKCPYNELKFFAQTLDDSYSLKGELKDYLLNFKPFLHAKNEKKDIEYDDIMKAFGDYTTINTNVNVTFLSKILK